MRSSLLLGSLLLLASACDSTSPDWTPPEEPLGDPPSALLDKQLYRNGELATARFTNESADTVYIAYGADGLLLPQIMFQHPGQNPHAYQSIPDDIDHPTVAADVEGFVLVLPRRSVTGYFRIDVPDAASRGAQQRYIGNVLVHRTPVYTGLNTAYPARTSSFYIKL